MQKIEGYYGYTAVQKIEGYYGDPAVYTCPFRACVHHHCNTAKTTPRREAGLGLFLLGVVVKTPQKRSPFIPPSAELDHRYSGQIGSPRRTP